MASRPIIFCLFVLLSPALSRDLYRHKELDEDERLLYRAAYDAPSYGQDEYEEEDDVNKLDLVKDGLWALKAKIKELKAFVKALAAHLLSTKLKVKDLLENHPLKHQHEKPSYNYQAPSYAPPQTPSYAPAQAPSYALPQAPSYPQAPAASYPPHYGNEQQYAHDPYYGH